MDKKTTDILTRIDRNDGMTVPDNFFEDFAEKMQASLPEMDWEKETPGVMPRSIWQRIRPYIYMAAMFAGIWLMMNMVDLLKPGSHNLSLDNNPVLTAAVSNDYYINDYFINHTDVDDQYLMDDLYTAGFDPSELEVSFEETTDI
ncbi:MAG: hypothetical protein NC098_07890 [Lachnoclostridium sp.]|nr:hypothetical protein [Lachnoclostridium sp.]